MRKHKCHFCNGWSVIRIRKARLCRFHYEAYLWDELIITEGGAHP